MGKTMLSTFLTQELEKESENPDNTVTLYYFCDGGDEKKNNAVSILRGLIFLLLRAKPSLMNVLLLEYEIQKENLFTHTAIEALWRIFESMVLDSVTGQVYCIIDGLDECDQGSLWHLLKKIKNFYMDSEEGAWGRSAPAQSQSSTIGVGLKMVLVSREAPRCLVEELSGFPRVQLGAAAQNESKTNTQTSRAPKLADVAAAVLRKATLEKAGTISTQVQPSSQQTRPRPHQAQNETLLDQRNAGSILSEPIAPPMDTPVGPTAQPNGFTDEKPDAEPDSVGDEVDEDLPSEESSQNPALQLYIDAKLEELSSEMHYPQGLRASITRAFQIRGDGTFLWVDLAVGELRRAPSQQAEEIIGHLPLGLDEMYCQILCRVPAHLVGLVAAILRWVFAARRPLYLHELSIALKLPIHNPADPIGLLEQGIAACREMIAVNEDQAVNTVHSSAKDFLTGNSPQLVNDPDLFRFRVCTEEVDREIAYFCLDYLEQGCLQDGPISYQENSDRYDKRVNQFPFLPYAALFWPDHLRSASNAFLNLFSPFFRAESAIRKSWWHTYWVATSGKAKFLAPRNFTLLHLAAYLNLRTLAEQLEHRGGLHSRLDKIDSHGGSPLAYAVERGHVSMFDFLIERGAKQDNNHGETLLEKACRKGQINIVEHLLNLGYNVNEQEKNINAIESLMVMVRWLPGAFNEGLDLNGDVWRLMLRDTGNGGTALHSAALYGHAAIVEMLLERKADVNAVTSKDWTALHLAAWTGQIECVKALLVRGALPDAKTDLGWIPFHCAASRAKLAVVQGFLELGISVDTMTAKQKTALHLSAYSGHASVVRLLVERGADLEAKSYKGETPLHLAARAGKPEVVELILMLGADRSVLSNAGQTPTELAKQVVSKEHLDAIQILETFGTPDYQPWQPSPDPKTKSTAADDAALNMVDANQKLHNEQHAPSLRVPPTSKLNININPTTDTYATPSFQASLRFGTQQSHYQPYRTASAPILPSTQQYTPASFSPPVMSPPPPYTPAPSGVPAFQAFPEKAQFAPATPFVPQPNSNPWPSPVSPGPLALADGRQPLTYENTPRNPVLGFQTPQTSLMSPPQPNSPQHQQSPHPPASPLSYTSQPPQPSQRPMNHPAYSYGPPITAHINQPAYNPPSRTAPEPTLPTFTPHAGMPTGLHTTSGPTIFTGSPSSPPAPALSTAATYSSQYEYNAPALTQPYIPEAQSSAYLSISFTPSSQTRPGTPNLYFAPPPSPSLQKKKSWRDLGGILK